MSLLRHRPSARRSRQEFYLLYRTQGPSRENTSTSRPLLSLHRGAHGDSEDFPANIVEYQDLTPFASVGAELDLETLRIPGFYAYRIHGAMCRGNGSVSAINGFLPKFAQIYLFDTEAAADVRTHKEGSRLMRPALSPRYAT